MMGQRISFAHFAPHRPRLS